MKKLSFLFLSILFPMVAFADAVEINGVYYTLNTDDHSAAVASNPNKYTGEVTIPSVVTYEEVAYDVKAIQDTAFFDCGALTSITVPSSVTSIGYMAFLNCESITSLSIPESVTTLGDYAFDNCRGITTLTIPQSITAIGTGVFCRCVGLTSLTIPNSVTSIGDQSFSGCKRLTSVTIPESVISIGNTAFYMCDSLASVTIQEGVTSIGNTAFSGCYALSSITVPNSVTSIGSSVFSSCYCLTTVSIGSGVTYIGRNVFASCNALKDVYCYAENVPSTHEKVFYSSKVSDNVTLHVPAASVEAYKSATPWNTFKNIVAIDEETGIADVRAKAVQMQFKGGKLNVHGIADGTRVSLYTIDGNLAGTATVRNGVATFGATLRTGTPAIVRIGHKSVKVVF